MRRPLLAVIAASTALLGAAAAHADTHWSVGINVPVAGVVVSNGGYYVQEPVPVYYAPVPEVRYAPVSRYYVVPEPYYGAPRVYAPGPVVYAEPRVVYQVPYRSWTADRDARWERHREFEHVRWEQERHEHRGHGHDDGDSHRWHRD